MTGQDLENYVVARIARAAAVFGLLVFIIGVVWVIHVRRTTPPCKQAQKRLDYIPTTGRLSVAYRDLNEDFFYGSLPAKKTKIRLGDLTAQEELGHIYQRDDGTWEIVIDRAGHSAERQAEMTLIHEMCHQEVTIAKANAGLSGHDGAFEVCMESVAKHGGFKDLW